MSLFFAKTHEWVNIDGKTAKIGISEHAAHSLGDIVFVSLPEVGAEFKAGDVLCDVESVKAVSEIFAPIACKVLTVNSELEDAPEKINADAMSAWLCEVEVISVPAGLLDEAGYKNSL